MIAMLHRKFRLAQGLLRWTNDARDFDKRLAVIRFANLFRRQPQHRLQQVDLRFSDLELRGMYTNRHASRSGGHVVLCQQLLTFFIKSSLFR